MIVTDIIAIDNKRSKVYIDEEYAFPLYRGEVYRYSIKKDGTIEQDVFREITVEILPKRVKLRAMNLLTKRPYTEHKLREKLRDGKYPNHYIDLAIDYVKSYGYIDDLQYAIDYIQTYHERLSKKQIRIKLTQKGISSELIATAMSQCEERDCIIDDTFVIADVLRKKNFCLNPKEDYKAYNKMLAYLLRRGFSMESINKVVKDSFT